LLGSEQLQYIKVAGQKKMSRKGIRKSGNLHL